MSNFSKPQTEPLERKPQIGYQSHIVDKINDLAAASPYRSRNEFLDACIQILDDMEQVALHRELQGRFEHDEILLLASVFKNQSLDFYPDPRYKEVIHFKVSQVLEHDLIDENWKIDHEALLSKLDALTEFQAYSLLITIIKIFARSNQIETDLFTAFGPKDFGFFIIAKSSVVQFNTDRLAGNDPHLYNYILGKKYSIEAAEKEVQYLEARDREADLFKADQYIVIDIDDDEYTGDRLDNAYRAMTAGGEREAEALDWSNSMIGDVKDKSR